MNTSLKRCYTVLVTLIGICLLIWGIFIWRIQITPPLVPPSQKSPIGEREQIGRDSYKLGNNWLRKNEFGTWEMYIEGDPYERGVAYGILAKELMHQQEEVFVEQIKEMIPRSWLLHTLRYFIGWFNRNIIEYIPLENQLEIYGVSQSFSDDFSIIGDKYYRILNYHAAHDIGHALTDLNMVGCTSFSVNDSLSYNNSLLIGRNFDFNMGDGFAENKIVLFVKPTDGYPFASISWAGFTGVVSGMNNQGLTVTLNAAKSDIPLGAKTPISILARQILQYARTIDEAIAIAAQTETFVSESLLIGSKHDNTAIVIEKTPTQQEVYRSQTPLLICSNHYQSSHFKRDKVNEENIRWSDSQYRFERMLELLTKNTPLNPTSATKILRDTRGKEDAFIGYGNPKSINQLLAHHGVLFQPTENVFWVSSNPYTLGTFIKYPLDSILAQPSLKVSSIIPADTLLESDDFYKFELFKRTKQRIQIHLLSGKTLKLSSEEIQAFIQNNPESYLPYVLLGDYFLKRGEKTTAEGYYRQSLEKEIASLKEQKQIENKLEQLLQKPL